MGRKRHPRINFDNTGFYSPALTEVEKSQMEDAGRVEGIDEEIALLRVRLRKLAGQFPERLDLQMELANVIARLAKTRHQISNEQKRSLKSAVTKVLEEVAVPLGIGLGVGVGGSLRR